MDERTYEYAVKCLGSENDSGAFSDLRSSLLIQTASVCIAFLTWAGGVGTAMLFSRATMDPAGMPVVTATVTNTFSVTVAPTVTGVSFSILPRPEPIASRLLATAKG